AIMGATGAVGTELLNLLAGRNFPLGNLKLLSSKRSAGKAIPFQGNDLMVEELTHDSFEGIDLVLASAGGSISKEFAGSAVKAGAVVVDNTSYFRMNPDVPLVVPEVNSADISKHNGIIANPNCSTILMLLPLWPLHQKFKVKRVVCATYQAASGAGAVAMQELEEESKALLSGDSYERSVIPHQYAFNLFPHNSPMGENGYCQEEMKMSDETKKIFGEPDFRVTATCVRVPILRAHSESLNIEFESDVSVEDAYQVLNQSPGVEILENRAENRWPMPIDATGKDPVFVGRIRKDISQANTLELWLTGDQIRKGAALNAIQIAERLFS
ncbi:MAG: aspartate-semialdehyde dehydrogenase, partial [Pseudomonadota bacterium]